METFPLNGGFFSLRGLFFLETFPLYEDSSLYGVLLYWDFSSLWGLFFMETFSLYGDSSLLKVFLLRLFLFTGFLLFTGTLLYGDFSSLRGGTLLYGDFFFLGGFFSLRGLFLMETFRLYHASSLYGDSSLWRLFLFTGAFSLYGGSSLWRLFLFTGFFSLQGLFFIETFLFTGLLLFTGFLLFTGTLLYGDFSSLRGGTLLFGHVSVPCKSEGQVKLGLLLKRPSFTRTFGLPRFDRAPLSSPHVHRRQVSSSLALIASTFSWYQSHKWRPITISAQCWIWLEPHLKLLMHDWKAPFFSITFRSQPLMGFSNLQSKATKTDIPKLLQSKFVAFPPKKLLMTLHFFPNWKYGF